MTEHAETRRKAAQNRLDQEDFVTSEPMKATPEALERLRLTVRVHDLEEALSHAVEHIRRWHGMGIGDRAWEQQAWDIYWNNAPEMQSLRRLLPDPQRVVEE